MYRRTLVAALAALHDGPLLSDSKARPEIRADLRSLHVTRWGRRGRHLILYRSDDAGVIEVVRILHDSMDVARHVPP
jgi:toxin ParE1/3/4